MGTKEAKQAIRKKIKRIRDGLSKKEILLKSKKIWDLLRNHKSYKDSYVIMFYSSIDNEVQTDFMIKEAIKEGKKIVLPQATLYNLIPRVIYNYPEDLSPGVFGILEPLEKMPIIEKNNIDLVIVPGIAFSKNCMRLGYGKGYYDKFLKWYNKAKVGIAFSEQVLAEIPYDEYDVPLDMIITDKNIIDCNKN